MHFEMANMEDFNKKSFKGGYIQYQKHKLRKNIKTMKTKSKSNKKTNKNKRKTRKIQKKLNKNKK
jgi:hypothetical protein